MTNRDDASHEKPTPQSPALKPLLVSVGEAMRVSGIGRTKLYQLINEGRIKTVMIGKRRLVLFASLEELAHAA